VKAKAVTGIALALRFAYGLRLLHGAVQTRNVLFDVDRAIQIADFRAIRLESGEVDTFSGKEWAPAANVSAFASLLVKIAIGASGGSRVSAAIPEFVLWMIEGGRSSISSNV
jgi:hypothetical protein